MRTAIVFNHPYERSFCAAILQSVVRGLEAAGHETDVLHLDNERFDPVMRAADLKAFTLGEPVDPQVLEYRERLAADCAKRVVADSLHYSPSPSR